MKRLFIISFALFFLTACNSPKPTQPIAPSPIPVISPTLVPSTSSSPQPVSTPDTSEWLPALDETIDVGDVDLDTFYLQQPIAIDTQHKRLYVATAVSHTLILDANTFAKIDEITIGGNLTLSSNRLFIGVPGAYASSGQQISRSELRAYDPQTLKLSPHIIYSDTSMLAAQVLVDDVRQKVYVVRSGVYEVDPATLRVIGAISGTVPSQDRLLPNYSAVDGAIDAAHHRLVVSVYNGIPGSNGGNVLSIYDLNNDTLLMNDGERSVQSIDVDPASGVSYVVRQFTDSKSIVSYDQNGKVLHRLDGLAGVVQIDAAHQQVYVFEQYPRARLIVLDADLNYRGEMRFGGIENVVAFRFDASSDRLLMLSRAGMLFTLKGHATPNQPAAIATAPSGSIQWLAPSPSYAIDHKLFAAFAIGDYVSGAGALFSTIDDGQTWQAIGGLPMSDTVSSLVFSANYQTDHTLIAALGSGVMVPSGASGIYRSPDDGHTWSSASQGLTDLSIEQIVVADQNTIFALGHKRGLFRSVDGGRSWSALADRYQSQFAYPNPALTALAVSPDFAQSKTIIISGQSGNVLTSHDGGETWTQTALSGASHISFLSSGQVLAALQNGNVIQSNDDGDHWLGASVGLDLSNGAATALPTTPERAALLLTQFGARGALYHWSAPNQRWDQIQIDQPITITAAVWVGATPSNLKLLIGTTNGQLMSMAANALKLLPSSALAINGIHIQTIVTPDGKQILIGNGSFGVWRSSDGGASWQDTGFPDRDLVHSMQVLLSPDYGHDATVFAAVGQGAYRSRDGGQIWALLKIPASGTFSIGAMAVSPNFASDHMIVVAGDYQSPGLYRSFDGGDTFSDINSQIIVTPTAVTKLLITSDGSWWAWLDYMGLYRSDDQGQSWSNVHADSAAVAQTLTVDPAGAIFIGQLYGTVLRSVDRGRTWESIGAGTFAEHVWISAIAFSPEYAIDHMLWIGTDNGLFRSTNGGISWSRSDNGLPGEADVPIAVLSISVSPKFASDHTLFAATSIGGLYVSHDGGTHWAAAH